MVSIRTPVKVISAILHGITMWVHMQTETDLRVHAPTVGSLRGPDVLLTAAFTEQFQSTGWNQFLLGRLSSRWGKSVNSHLKSTDPSYPKIWMAQLISFMWKFSHLHILYFHVTIIYSQADHWHNDCASTMTASHVGYVLSRKHSRPYSK